MAHSVQEEECGVARINSGSRSSAGGTLIWMDSKLPGDKLL
jgi:hypothetical protein